MILHARKKFIENDAWLLFTSFGDTCVVNVDERLKEHPNDRKIQFCLFHIRSSFPTTPNQASAIHSIPAAFVSHESLNEEKEEEAEIKKDLKP